jgi:hypothetical protein
MASSTTDDTTSDGTDSDSGGGMLDGIINFLTQPLGMGLALGVIVTAYAAWRWI